MCLEVEGNEIDENNNCIVMKMIIYLFLNGIVRCYLCNIEESICDLD